jgi:hypothetical protein
MLRPVRLHRLPPVVYFFSSNSVLTLDLWEPDAGRWWGDNDFDVRFPSGCLPDTPPQGSELTDEQAAQLGRRLMPFRGGAWELWAFPDAKHGGIFFGTHMGGRCFVFRGNALCHCGEPAGRVCTQCWTQRYCSRHCQKLSWNNGSHKRACAPF